MSSLDFAASGSEQAMMKVVRDGQVISVPDSEVTPTDEIFVSWWKNFRRRWYASVRYCEYIGKWYHIDRRGRRMFIPSTELRSGDTKLQAWFEGTSPPFPGQEPKP